MHIFVSYNNFQPRVMSHSLPHLRRTTNTSSLSHISSASPIFPTDSPSHTQTLRLSTHIYPAMFHGRVADQHKSHLSQVMRPKSVEIKATETEAIEPEDLEPRNIELDKILGTEQYQTQERFTRSTHRCIPIMIQRRALQTRILNIEN